MVEWVAVTRDTALIATSERAWLHPLAPGDPFARPMPGPGSLATTRTLLDAAVGLFQHQRLRADAAPLTVERYVDRVLSCYHGGRATPPLMRRAAERFLAAERQELAAWATQTAQAEDHDHLALDDLAELGYPPDVVATMPCPATMRAAITYFEGCVHGDHPVSCLGYIYALERPASLVQASYVEEIEKLLGPTVNATRCLRWHSGLGAEPGHVDYLLGVIAALPAGDRSRVARAVFETSRIVLGEVVAVTDPNPEERT